MVKAPRGSREDIRRRERKWLANAPDWVAVVGEPQFPPACVNCGQPPAGSVEIRRVFSYVLDTSEGLDVEHIEAFLRVPCCAACAATHAAEASRAPGSTSWLRTLTVDGAGAGGLIICCVGLVFAYAAATSDSLPGALAMLMMTCGALTTGGLLLFGAWKQSRFSLPSADTVVSRAVEFTDLLQEGREPPWRAYRFRNDAFAALFREANADRLRGKPSRTKNG